MAVKRFSISMAGEIHDRIKKYADDAGLDVSTYLTIAAQAQMDQQDRVKEFLQPFEAARLKAEEEAGTGTWAGDDIVLTSEEQAEVDAILGRAPRGRAAA
ncbi:hypothetical protein [Streptomyces sp. CC208A]|uniref:hypothetical protein n=1 Tax=Streptomyces sp. CC208A TaxID=3044573 RepID=UPI0024A886EE|nr:hypothetical protein [Streptomyces sp. CC208A]